MSDHPLVRTDHLTKTYGDHRVVDDLSVAIPEGAVAVLLGPNGAGKSTTLEIVATLRLPSSGRVEVAGHDVAHRPGHVRAVVGHVPQANALDPLMTVGETLTFQARAAGIGRGAARTTEVVDLLRLSEYLAKRVATLSGGTRRRVDLALALLGSPRLLILDEPTTGLDPASRLDLWGELRRLVRSEGLTVLMSTQDLHEAEVLASELYVLRSGALVAHGTPAEIKARIGVRTLVVEATSTEGAAIVADRLAARAHRAGRTVQVPLGPEPDAPWVALLGELAAVAAQVETLSVHEPTLDDAFAALAMATPDATCEVPA